MEIKPSDLYSKCEGCKGQGTVENPAMGNQNAGYGQARVVWASPVPCQPCNGTGIILTRSGEAVIEFINIARAKHLLPR